MRGYGKQTERRLQKELPYSSGPPDLDRPRCFLPPALHNDLIFELTLAAAHQVVKGSDASKLIYKLINIQLEYEIIRSKTLADEATSAYLSGKEFAYDNVMREEVASFATGTDARLNIRINP